MSSIAVVGLLPAQARKIADAFPKSGLKFVPRDREREAPALLANFDQILIMTKFISHSTWHSLPREKLLPVNGGMTELKAKLKKLVSKAPKKEVVKTMVEDVDYTVLKTAAPGEAFIFKLPAGDDLTAFEKRVGAMRSYYKRHYQVESQQKTVGNEIHILVNKAGKEESVAAAPKPAAPEEARRLWSESYLRFISILPGASGDELARRADEAVAAFRERFP